MDEIAKLPATSALVILTVVYYVLTGIIAIYRGIVKDTKEKVDVFQALPMQTCWKLADERKNPRRNVRLRLKFWIFGTPFAMVFLVAYYFKEAIVSCPIFENFWVIVAGYLVLFVLSVIIFSLAYFLPLLSSTEPISAFETFEPPHWMKKTEERIRSEK